MKSNEGLRWRQKPVLNPIGNIPWYIPLSDVAGPNQGVSRYCKVSYCLHGTSCVVLGLNPIVSRALFVPRLLAQWRYLYFGHLWYGRRIPDSGITRSGQPLNGPLQGPVLNHFICFSTSSSLCHRISLLPLLSQQRALSISLDEHGLTHISDIASNYLPR